MNVIQLGGGERIWTEKPRLTESKVPTTLYTFVLMDIDM